MATDAAGIALWSWNVDTDEIALDERAHGLWGVPQNSPVTFEDLSARIHPADLERVRTAFTATRATVGLYEIDFRLLHGDEVRWISARGQGADDGTRPGHVRGLPRRHSPRTGRGNARDARGRDESSGQEPVRHRRRAHRNRGAPGGDDDRDGARSDAAADGSGRAHDLVRPIPGQEERRAAPLRDLLAALLAPYDDRGAVATASTSPWQRCVSAKPRRQRSRWWSTSWRPTRSSMARFRSRAARSTCRASSTTTIW